MRKQFILFWDKDVMVRSKTTRVYLILNQLRNILSDHGFRANQKYIYIKTIKIKINKDNKIQPSPVRTKCTVN